MMQIAKIFAVQFQNLTNKSLSAVIQKFDYVFFPDTLNKTVGATDRSPEHRRGMPRPYAKLVD